MIGLSIGWALAKKSVDVTILEEGYVGKDASWASAGMLSARVQVDESAPGVSSSAQELLKLEIVSKELWKDFSANLEKESGIRTGYRRAIPT